MTAPEDRVWRQARAAPDGPRHALEKGLTPADLQTLLLGVSRRRAAAVSPARLRQRWRDDRYVRPAGSDPRRVWALEARLWDLLPGQFDGVDLSPVAPLGQPFDQPGAFPHFRLFTLVSSARDRGSGSTEAELRTTHLQFWVMALSDLLPDRATTISYTVFGFPPLKERLADTVLPALAPLPPAVTLAEDPARQRARGYYERGALRIDVAPDAGEREEGQHEIGDGGFTDWTARLRGDAKERCLISCVSTERMTSLAARAKA